MMMYACTAYIIIHNSHHDLFFAIHHPQSSQLSLSLNKEQQKPKNSAPLQNFDAISSSKFEKVRDSANNSNLQSGRKLQQVLNYAAKYYAFERGI